MKLNKRINLKKIFYINFVFFFNNNDNAVNYEINYNCFELILL